MANNAKPYRLPDPDKNPEAFLVLLYKTLKRIEFNDRGWDTIYFPRCMKRTQQLLENVGGDVRKAAQCMQDLKERFEADGWSWTIETIVQYCFEWRSEHDGRTDRDCLRGLTAAYAGTTAKLNLFKPERRQIALAVAPPCGHPGFPGDPGKEWPCPACREVLYTPKPGELDKLLASAKEIA